MTISRELLTPVLAYELLPLIAANQAATGRDESARLQWSVFYELEAGGALCLLIARVDGVAVGYCAHAAIVSHSTGNLAAVCLGIYLDPAHRAMAKALVREAEAHASAAGCQTIEFAVPHLSNAGAFFETVMGYGCRELVMAKGLPE